MARSFLKKGDSLTLSAANSTVLGAIGAETLNLANTALNSGVNSNVDTISFTGKLSDYKFSVQGTNLLVFYNNSTLATIGIQTDTDGSALKFSDTTTTAVLSGLSVATLGKAVLTSTATSYTIDALQTVAQKISTISTTQNSLTLTSAADTVSVDTGSYSGTIANFSLNDKLDFNDAMLASLQITNSVKLDGNLLLSATDGSNSVQLTLTGLAPAADIYITSVATFKTVFGSDSLF
jgi:hypothetical protein